MIWCNGQSNVKGNMFMRKKHLKQDFRLIGEELSRMKPIFYLGDNIQNGVLPKNKLFHNSLE